VFGSWLVLLPPAAYQLLAITAALFHLSRKRAALRRPTDGPLPGVSVLKPVRGLDPNTEEAFLSQINQEHPEFEVLFGVRSEADPAVQVIRRLQAAYPEKHIGLVMGARDTPNGKVGILSELAAHARHPVWVVNDGDIRVDPAYLTMIVAPLRDPTVGIVTCPYRAMAHTLPATWESLGIATDFMPSTLVAPLVGVREFGLGSTLAFRAADLAQSGGFAPIADYIADDYQLAKRITGLGKRAVLSGYVVETSLGEDTWSGIWWHQLRWARTIRTSKGGGYLGLPITHAGVWVAVFCCVGAYVPGAILLTLRVASALIAGGLVLGSKLAIYFCWLAPVWDLYAFAIWITSYTGRRVRWRDKSLEIDRQGRIVKESSQTVRS
jgi:ceramide glucosyltransferase